MRASSTLLDSHMEMGFLKAIKLEFSIVEPFKKVDFMVLELL